MGVKKLGMSEKVGLRVQYDDPVQNMEYGPSTRELTDEEINRLLNESYKRATDLLTKHKKELILLEDNLVWRHWHTFTGRPAAPSTTATSSFACDRNLPSVSLTPSPVSINTLCIPVSLSSLFTMMCSVLVSAEQYFLHSPSFILGRKK